MNVQALWIYPVKSLAGIEVEAFELDEFGPRGDRRWMLVDDAGCFVSQRDHPELARITTALEGREVVVDIPHQGAFRLEAMGESVAVEVWGDSVSAVMGGEPANNAVSKFCNRSLRFVFMPAESFRQIDPDYVSEHRRVGFADGYPLLIANQASLDELNDRLGAPAEIRQFRPNVVVSGAEPWAEDNWRRVSIGTTEFRLVKPCSRCVMTTVDPDAGVKAADGQPLKTLAGYRRKADGVIFGMNAIHLSHGLVRVGDAVSVTN
ncbi:MOSC domain-containing protein [Marinobacter salinisoli]|uniref:MOSC domain-containing protein n=1 Tax=Marinobacter salinisoli TaxID=2769486 RepID=A0ABX7MPF6_9GAMM|nr:MOSC N-terminal beta barrel domain-containing protein [Marinobacter salinisoli]QSP94073.1 MOSC domain-containing protein [Marinobacter salinisoli]